VTITINDIMKLLHALLVYSAALLPAVVSQDNIPGAFMTCTKPGTFALTFDDGPSTFTPELLSVLEQEHVKATFFLLGQYVSTPALQAAMKQAHAAGHQLASHTWDHPHLPNITTDQVRDQLKRTAEAMKSVIPEVDPFYVRAPYGEINAGVMAVFQEMDYVVIQWNIDSNDWRFNRTRSPGTRVLSEFVKELAVLPTMPSTPPAQSYISLQHDTQSFSVREVREVIRLVKSKGFTFATVADCVGNPKPFYRSQQQPAQRSTSLEGDNGAVKAADSTPSSALTTQTSSLLVTIGLATVWMMT
jgi:peptidoglycan/xylan/chitin deacetylase (PgdA/CDA1 family)